MSFVETRINDAEIVYETVGGPRYSTDVVVLRSGHEARNQNWSQARGRWELGERLLKQSELDTLVAFFHGMRGRATGFRFKDWADFKATSSQGILGAAIGDGLPTKQMYRRYTVAAQNLDRKITKPVSGTVTAYRNTVVISGATVSLTTGIVTMPALASVGITAITKANPGVVTTASAHGYANGEKIYISGVAGMTQVNTIAFTIAGVTSTTFQLGVDTSGYSTYTSGGTAAKYAQPADTLAWSGDFDVPVRFDADEIRTRFEARDPSSGEQLHFLFSLPLVEIRL